MAAARRLVARNNKLSTRCPGASNLPALTAWFPAGRILAMPETVPATLLARAILLLGRGPGGCDTASSSLLTAARCDGLPIEAAEEEDRMVGVMGGDIENWLLLLDILAFLASGPLQYVGTRSCEADTATLVVWLVGVPLVDTRVVPEGRPALVVLAER